MLIVQGFHAEPGLAESGARICGRYFRPSDKQRIAEAFHLGVFEDLPLEVASFYNIAPTAANEDCAPNALRLPRAILKTLAIPEHLIAVSLDVRWRMADIVSVQDEEAARLKGEAAARFNEFISLWTLETMPACDDGMILLLQFADANPNAYRLAEQRGFTEMTHPMFNTLAKWKTYAVHVSTCPKCNEV